jgi:hypothetical protein
MKYRIALWASAGFLVACCWALYAFATTPPAMTSADPIVTLVEFTCPVVFASIHFHFALGLYWSLPANAATYGLIGLIVEVFGTNCITRNKFNTAHYQTSALRELNAIPKRNHPTCLSSGLEIEVSAWLPLGSRVAGSHRSGPLLALRT